jgi:phosphoglucosamine mutase
VLEKMIETGCVLGGEQSGHIIFMDISPTGDGIISALEFLNVLVTNDYNIDEIYSVIPKFPQVLKNIKISDKERILSSENIQTVIDAVSAGLGSKGRLLVRPSGTEPLIRVMAEAETQKSAEDAVQTVIDAISAED